MELFEHAGGARSCWIKLREGEGVVAEENFLVTS